jgi:hypothetical protein
MKLHSLRLILDEAFESFGDKSEYVVAAPQYRAAANTARDHLDFAMLWPFTLQFRIVRKYFRSSYGKRK